MVDELTPRQVVTELDRYVVGQHEAKRKVAVALRNRLRRRKVLRHLQEDLTPKNILMIGPTGVGKTELARRLAKLAQAPFVKVEATRFTEVGYVGRDVESMVRDLAEVSFRLVKEELIAGVHERAQSMAEDRLVDLLCGHRPEGVHNPFEMFFGGGGAQNQAPPEEPKQRPSEVRRKLEAGLLEDDMIDVEVEDSAPLQGMFQIPGMESMGPGLQDALSGMLPKRRRKRRMSVREARPVIEAQEAEGLIDQDRLTSEAIERAEQSGIIFIDEIDKVCGEGAGGAQVSREGVQRDILPIVEGTTVSTRYGTVRTDHVLFIAAGAFHVSSPSDLIPELQGRFPVRVELSPLTADDFRRILTEPENAITRQYAALLEADGVHLTFTDDALDALAGMAAKVNAETEDIGARRLHTIVETCLEEVAFEAPDPKLAEVVVDRAFVDRRLASLVGNRELSRYIL